MFCLRFSRPRLIVWRKLLVAEVERMDVIFWGFFWFMVREGWCSGWRIGETGRRRVYGGSMVRGGRWRVVEVLEGRVGGLEVSEGGREVW